MTTLNPFKPIGCWHSGDAPPEPLESALQRSLLNVSRPLYVVERPDGLCVSQGGTAALGSQAAAGGDRLPLRAYAPPLPPEALGDPVFKAKHGLRYAYVAGEMANGITSVRMVTAVGQAGMVGFFGAAGLMPAEVESALARLQSEAARHALRRQPDPQPRQPRARSRPGRSCFCAGRSGWSAPRPTSTLRIPSCTTASKASTATLPAASCARTGWPPRCPGSRSPAGFWRRRRKRFSRHLVGRGWITAEEAALAAAVPMADDVTAEADSGGHTDNRPAITLLPTMLALRNEMSAAHAYPHPPCVGLGGGIATPEAAAAAFAMGAAYVVTGSINQSCVEAGTSPAVCTMLAEAGQADVTMAPAADMFELGVKVQVLKRGTMFPHRAAKLYELYTAHDRFDQLPVRQREIVEKEFLKCSFDEEWEQTKQFFLAAATPSRSNGPKKTPSTAWRWCSAPTWAAPPPGPSPASRPAESTTRSGAARPWAPSTSG